MNRPSRLR